MAAKKVKKGPIGRPKEKLSAPKRKKALAMYCDGAKVRQVADALHIPLSTWNKIVARDPLLKEEIKVAREESARVRFEDTIDMVKDVDPHIIDPETGKLLPNTTGMTQAKIVSDLEIKLCGIDNNKYNEKSRVDVTSNGESVSGFVGLTIIYPKDEEDSQEE